MDPGKCDEDVYGNGTHVLCTHSVPKDEMERMCRLAADRLGKKVDWYYFGGRIVVVTMAERSAFVDDFEKFWKAELAELQKKQMQKIDPDYPFNGPWYSLLSP